MCVNLLLVAITSVTPPVQATLVARDRVLMRFEAAVIIDAVRAQRQMLRGHRVESRAPSGAKR